MRVLRQILLPPTGETPVVLAIGYFDGVHRGHQAVLQAAREAARTLDGEAWVLTFDPHPLRLVRPEKTPRMLTAVAHKERLFRRLGLDGCIVAPFTPEIRDTSAEDFLHLLRERIGGLRRIVVGEQWAFGCGQTGNLSFLKRFAEARGLDIIGVPHVLWRGQAISSTRIRKAVLQGDLEAASAMLGRPFSLFGNVVRGRGIGRTLGFPTANVNPQNEVHLPDGIYAAQLETDEDLHPAAAYIGQRPSFKESDWVVEVHLLEEACDLYGQDVEVRFLEKIREDRAFPHADALKEQMRKDVQTIRALLTSTALCER